MCKDIGHNWQDILITKLQKEFKEKEPSMKKIIEVAIDYGVLNRIAPQDDRIRKAREKKGRTLWEKDRNDPNLYLRLIYELESIKYAIKNSYSVCSHFTIGLTIAFNNALHPDHYAKFFSEKELMEVVEEFFNKAKRALEKRMEKLGVTPPNILKIGDSATITGINIVVKEFSVDGRIIPEINNLEEHMKIGKISNYTSAIDPSLIHFK